MKLFEMKNWQLTVSEEAWGLLPFKKILDRDKSKEKELALKEMLFIFYFCDIKSDYGTIFDEKEKIKEIKHDIGLPESWEIDKTMQEAIDLYNKRNTTVIQELYKDTIKSASEIGGYLRNTRLLLEERDSNGRPIYDIAKITSSAEKIPGLMRKLRDAYSEVVKEQIDNDNKKKGKQQFNTFEDGLI
jgi:hypothetical protein